MHLSNDKGTCKKCGKKEVYADENDYARYCHARSENNDLCGHTHKRLPRIKIELRGRKRLNPTECCDCGSKKLKTYENKNGDIIKTKRCRKCNRVYQNAHRRKKI